MRRKTDPQQEAATCRNLAYRSRRTALTLVEMLLTVVLSAMLVTATATVTVHSARVSGELAMALEKQWATLRLRDRFRADVAGRLQGLSEFLPRLQVPVDPDELLEVTTLVDASDLSSPLPRRSPARVTYLRRRSPRGDNTATLLRRVAPMLQGGERPSEEILADGLELLEAEEYRSGRWGPVVRAKTTDTEPPSTGLRLRFRGVASDEVDQTCTAFLSELAVSPKASQ